MVVISGPSVGQSIQTEVASATPARTRRGSPESSFVDFIGEIKSPTTAPCIGESSSPPAAPSTGKSNSPIAVPSTGENKRPTAAPTPKRPRTVAPLLPVDKHLHDVQLQLQTLDEQCGEEQMNIQLAYDAKRRPHFEKRAALLRAMPGFWKAALTGHPSGLACHDELDALSFLHELELKDNLDRLGSYEVTITFSEGAPFQETKATKKVTFSDGDGLGDGASETIEAATLTALDDCGRRALAAVSVPGCKSVLGWFIAKEATSASMEDLAEVLRRELWQDPIPSYINAIEMAAQRSPCNGSHPSRATGSGTQ